MYIKGLCNSFKNIPLWHPYTFLPVVFGPKTMLNESNKRTEKQTKYYN